MLYCTHQLTLWGIQIQKPNAQQKGDLSTKGNMLYQNEKSSGEVEGKTQRKLCTPVDRILAV